jgi:hypothetical protein
MRQVGGVHLLPLQGSKRVMRACAGTTARLWVEIDVNGKV